MIDEPILPMLARSSGPFDDPGYLYEIKWDGSRCILFMQKDQVRLQNRRLLDITYRYPELHLLYQAIDAHDAVLDGELIVLTEGKSDFGKLQQREHVADALKAKLYARQMPVMYMAFDILYQNGQSYLQAPLHRRKEKLKTLLKPSPYLSESRHIAHKGKAFFEQAMSHGLEGIMAKRTDSPYVVGKRSPYWLKIKPEHLAHCYVVGYTRGQGARKNWFGALAVATREEEEWVYRGRVGSGFTENALAALSPRLRSLKSKTPPLPLPRETKPVQWVRPELKCEVMFREITPGGRFRAPVFKRMLN